ncbi:L-lactate MFS transporter [Dictyoglomus thermophilum]|uniref:Oxalate/formate antiporter n=2 Tax=Dictyoglomus thermophilum TaxID=14 RepID=B5YCI0_DICT6|nr:OFA family MFS transporter [Dictyoglomus thermophilum]ACI18434.1 oxalate/formate antiporter [Dictyoglomus thermophilum H-6-12]MCX7720102.1 OFA family MFS transporter [Dictyoglomus thermophilum]TYT23424.1 OFA family MFS transporter [Dictyoglomus thermophilum]
MNSTNLLKRRWFLIPLGIIIYICLGTVYSWSVFRKPLENILQISAFQSGLPYMLFLFFFALFMALSGKYVSKYPRLIIFIGGLIVGLGWILSGFFRDIKIIAITYGIIAGSGVGIVYGVPITVISKWFPDKRGLAMGLVISGFGLSPLITAPLARYLIELYGPFETFKILGLIFLILLSLLSLAFKLPPLDFSVGALKTTKRKILAELNTREMLKSSKFYGLWLCYTLGTLIGLMIIGITSPVGEEIVGLDPKFTASLVSFFAIFNAVGRPLFGWITDRIFPRKASIVSYLLAMLASLLMISTGGSNLGVYIISFSLFWLILGSWLAIAPASTIILFGERNYGQNYGIVFTAYGVGAILGGTISGILRDLLGSYFYVFYVIIGLSIVGILITLALLKEN